MPTRYKTAFMTMNMHTGDLLVYYGTSRWPSFSYFILIPYDDEGKPITDGQPRYGEELPDCTGKW